MKIAPTMNDKGRKSLHYTFPSHQYTDITTVWTVPRNQREVKCKCHSASLSRTPLRGSIHLEPLGSRKDHYEFILSFEKVAHDRARRGPAFHLHKASFYKRGSQAGEDRHGVFLFASRIYRIPFDNLRTALSSESDCSLEQLPGQTLMSMAARDIEARHRPRGQIIHAL